MDWLNSLGVATSTGNVLRLLVHKLDLDQRQETANLSSLDFSLLVEI